MLMFKINYYGNIVKNKIKKFFTKENGEVNIIAMVILIAIAVGLAIIFRNQIAGVVKKLFADINDKTDGIGDIPE